MKLARIAAWAFGLPAMFLIGFFLLTVGPEPPDTIPMLTPVVVGAEPRLQPLVVRAPRRALIPRVIGSIASIGAVDGPLLKRRRLPVQITQYCLKGTTRRGNPVRPGILAADPRVIPLGSVVDLYVGLRYEGRFLIDDTGGVIKGQIVDMWVASCKDAIRFGRRRGAVVLVESPPPRRRRR